MSKAAAYFRKDNLSEGKVYVFYDLCWKVVNGVWWARLWNNKVWVECENIKENQ